MLGFTDGLLIGIAIGVFTSWVVVVIAMRDVG